MKHHKRNTVSYYTGWGIAYGTFGGAVLDIMLDMPGVPFFLGIAIGAAVGTVYGKMKERERR